VNREYWLLAEHGPGSVAAPSCVRSPFDPAGRRP
jgi:hypothetical protein